MNNPFSLSVIPFPKDPPRLVLLVQFDDQANFPDNNKDAFQMSIDKWKYVKLILVTNELNIRSGEVCRFGDGGPKTCALCDLHWDYGNCNECPIAANTGFNVCQETPYETWNVLLDLAIENNIFDYDALLQCAENEISFLKQLSEKLFPQSK